MDRVAWTSLPPLAVHLRLRQSPKDMGLRIPVVNAAPENTRQIQTRVLADTGVKNERDVAQLEAVGIDGGIPVGRERKAARSPSSE